MADRIPFALERTLYGDSLGDRSNQEGEGKEELSSHWEEALE